MLRKLRPHLSFANVTSMLALSVALGGTGAYAANTVFSTDIVDNEVRSADVRDDTLSGGGLGSIDIRNGEMTTNEIRDDTQAFGGLFSQDLAAGSVRTSEVQDGSLFGADISDGSLRGDDINESTLNMPPSTTVHFVGPSAPVSMASDGTMTHITGANLPPGDYAAVATANLFAAANSDHIVQQACELRGPNNNYIGGATDRRDIPGSSSASVLYRTSLSMNGGAHNSSSSTGISLWCSSDIGPDARRSVQSAQIMITKLDGFF